MKLVSLVSRCIFLVLFPEDDPLQIETCINIQCDIVTQIWKVQV